MSNARPLFIVIEGVDGSGKSTQIEWLKERFNSIGEKAYVTHEPTDSPIGSVIRNIMKGRIQTSPAAIACLFAADRLDHIDNPSNGMRIKKEEGYHIIGSRYYFSNYAFQGEYVPIDWLIELNRIAKERFKPDLIIYLNVDPETCFERIMGGRSDIELYETKEKISKVHAAYLECFQRYGKDEHIIIIDANQNIQTIADEIWRKIQDFRDNQ